MNILLDIVHPAHVHFFRHPIALLKKAGHSVIIASRDKDCTLDLLDELGLPHVCISSQSSGGLVSMARELWKRNWELARLARRHECRVIAGVGGIAAAQASLWTGAHSVVFYDTEAAKLQNALCYPFAGHIVVPECYTGWVPKRKTSRYRGYHELSYLHPDRFRPQRKVAVQNGLAEHGHTFLIRLVSWKANHDIGLEGWSRQALEAVIDRLLPMGRVIISSEQTLPNDLVEFAYSGDRSAIHHVAGHCRLTIGESATMASESVVLGVPAIYAAPSFRGYITEQEVRYGMARFIKDPTPEALVSAIDEVMGIDWEVYRTNYEKLLVDCTDVSEFISRCLSREEDAVQNSR